GVVKDFSTNPAGDPVAGATVSIPGYPTVQSNAQGAFTIPNVNAGPNGPRCFTNPFSIRAGATANIDADPELEAGVSPFATAVSGGTTDVGCIVLGTNSTVEGKALKLTCRDPFTVEPIAGLNIRLNPRFGLDFNTTTDAFGCYSFTDVPNGTYSIFVSDPGFDFQECKGDTFHSGSIQLLGETDIHDFLLLATGKTKVTVTDENGNPSEFVGVNVRSLGGEPLGQGFESDFQFLSGQTDDSGCVLITGLPIGTYEIFSGFGGKFVPPPGLGGGGEVLATNTIDCEGQCNTDDVVIIPPDFSPCDLLAVDISRVDIDTTNSTIEGVQFALTFDNALDAVETEIDFNVFLLFDTDVDDTTGRTWFAGPGEPFEGIDRRFDCFLSPFGPPNPNNCDMISYENGFEVIQSDFIGFEIDPLDATRILMTLPNDAAALEDIIGTTTSRVYISVECYSRNTAGSSFDRYPNTIDPRPAAIDFLLPFNDTDPQGDPLIESGGIESQPE
ncbi:MAG: carboxypeptidase regulatory-like domain-containing protein, partial [Akkermansiaceae bacterium]|nr:carboxypeptidase regulatory-like domain-containing protein [Akkermansiaceae bacterium]